MSGVPKEKLTGNLGSPAHHPVCRRFVPRQEARLDVALLVVVLSFVLPAPEVLAGRKASDRAQQWHQRHAPPLLRSEGALGGPVGLRFQPQAPGSPRPARQGLPSWGTGQWVTGSTSACSCKRAEKERDVFQGFPPARFC